MTTRNKGNAQAMEAGVDSALPEEFVNAAVLISREPASDRLFITLHLYEGRDKLIRHWYSKEFPGVGLVSFSVDDRYCSVLNVDPAGLDRAFREAASGVRCNPYRTPYPRGFSPSSIEKGFNLLIAKFRFDLRSLAREAEVGKWVGLYVVTAPRFVENLREELHLGQGRVAAYRAFMHSCSNSPSEIVLRVFVPDLPRIHNPLGSEKGFDRAPHYLHPLPGACGLARPVRLYKLRNPNAKCGVARRMISNLFFLFRSSLSHPLRLARLHGIISSQSGCLFSPPASVEVAPPQIPIWRFWVSAKVRHSVVVLFMVKSLSHALTWRKWTSVVFRGFIWAAVGKSVLPLSTVTPRGKGERTAKSKLHACATASGIAGKAYPG